MKDQNDFSSTRKFNKWRHQFPLGRDIKGKTLYPGDYIKIDAPDYVPTPWCAMILYETLDGAYFDAHPRHIKNNDNQIFHQLLHEFIGRNKTHDAVIRKITIKEYDQWVEQQRINESINIEKPREFLLNPYITTNNDDAEW